MRLILTFVILFLVNTSFSLVDMRMANYTERWTDIEVPGNGFDLKVIRTYNSRTLYNGYFGFGWCSNFETRMEKTPEGSLKVTECGAGLEILYYPNSYGKEELNAFVEKILNAAKRDNSTKAFLTGLGKRLRANPKARFEYARKYNVTQKAKEGTKYLANGTEVEYVVLKDGKYVRKLTDGTTQTFNKNGQMIKIYDRNGNHLQLRYKGRGLASITDNNGRQLNIKTNSSNRITKIIGPNNLKAEYLYKGSDLIVAKNFWGNAYGYKYDRGHNLVRINYPDKTNKQLTYDKNRDLVTSFTDRKQNGVVCKETYKHGQSKSNPRYHYWTDLNRKCGKKVVNKSRYEFWYKIAEGREYLHRAKTVVNGRTNDVTYHAKFPRPTKVINNGVKTEFSYYDNGLIKTRKTGKQTARFRYKNKCGKVSDVRIGKAISAFKYDGKCNLKTAKNSNGQVVKISYDRKGRIRTLKDQAKRLVQIDYNEKFGKPKLVKRPGLGSIKVSYTTRGQIKKVDSPDGPAVAVQVASAFNNLLEIVRPAGVELGL